jgi:hypothetical protein
MTDAQPDYFAVLARLAARTTYGPLWFATTTFAPQAEDEADYNPRADWDPFGHEADRQALREYGRG